MDNKGFTLVEILSVIALLALIVIITVPAINGVSDNIKKSTLKTKIENIEKAAVLYGQEHRENFVATCNSEGELCYNITGECSCYSLTYTKTDAGGNVLSKDTTTIPVSKLLNPSVALTDGDYAETYVNSNEKPYIEADDNSGNIINPLNDMPINTCEIQIYQKYGKIYAVYIDKKTSDNEYNLKCGY